MIEFKQNKNKKILFCTGAGASQESGIPTFRDPRVGLWRNYDPSEIASVSALANNKVEANKFYSERREMLANVETNYFHEFVDLMQKKYGKENVFIMTTNVDDLHERAGSDVLKIHGNITEIRDEYNNVIDLKHNKTPDDLLSSVRPNVVLFGEGSYIKNDKQYNPYKDVEEIVMSMNKDDLIIIVGCSNNVVDFSRISFGNYKLPKVVIVNPYDAEKLKVSNNELLIKKTACESVPDLEDIIVEFFEKEYK